MSSDPVVVDEQAEALETPPEVTPAADAETPPAADAELVETPPATPDAPQ